MYALGTESEQDGRDRVEVAVTAGHVRDRLKPEAALHTSREHCRIHPCPCDGIVRDGDGMNPRRLKFPCSLHKFIRISGIGRIEFNGNRHFPRCQCREKGALRRYKRSCTTRPLCCICRMCSARQCAAKGVNVRGRCAAAAADDGNALTYGSGKSLAEVVGRTLIDGAPVNHERMPRIWHEGERQRTRAEILYKLLHCLNTVDTVKTDGINIAARRNLTHEFLGEESVTRIAAGEGGERGQDKRLGTNLLDMSRRFDQPFGGGICFKEEVPCPRSQKNIGKEAIFLDDLRRRQP